MTPKNNPLNLRKESLGFKGCTKACGLESDSCKAFLQALPGALETLLRGGWELLATDT